MANGCLCAQPEFGSEEEIVVIGHGWLFLLLAFLFFSSFLLLFLFLLGILLYLVKETIGNA